MQELKRLQGQGRIRFVGLAMHDLRLIEQGGDSGSTASSLIRILRRLGKRRLRWQGSSDLYHPDQWKSRGVDPRTRPPRVSGDRFEQERALASSLIDLCQAVGTSPLVLRFLIVIIDITLTDAETMEQLEVA